MKSFDFINANLKRPKYVALYTTREVGIEHILNDKKIRFTTLSEMNEPYEYTRHSAPVMSYGLGKDVIFSVSALKEEIISNGKLKLFCTSAKGEDDFIEAATLSNMWAHYGQKHEGMCFIFDFDKLSKNIAEKFPFHRIDKVNYDNYLIKSMYNNNPWSIEIDEDTKTEMDIVQYIFNNPDLGFYFRKNEEWEQQFEWRFLIYSEKSNYDYLSIDNSLSAVVLGDRFPNIYNNLIEEKCKLWENDVDLYKIEFSQGKLEMRRQSHTQTNDHV